jgi:hypothetical protein
MSTQMMNRIYTLWKSCLNGNMFAKAVMISLLVGLSLLAGCSDDDFEGADVVELENRTFLFADARAFGLSLQPALLTIGMFGDGALSDDETPFTLDSNGTVAQGILDLDEGDNPFGSDFSRCDFEISTSAFTVAGLLPGDNVETDCVVTEDDLELQLENRNTSEVSTGQLQ